MNHCPDQKEFELMCIIVCRGMGSKVLGAAKKSGVSGGTVFLGKGTVKNRLLKLLDLCDSEKEIIIMLSEKETAYETLEKLNQEFRFYKPNHGIAFSTSVAKICGVSCYSNKHIKENEGEETIMYNVIFVVVDKGMAENVIEEAAKAGSKGGTIINARGSGIHETSKLFAMDIEPEKEVVLILSETHKTDEIVTSVRENLHIDQPGKGIIFVQNVNKAYGLY